MPTTQELLTATYAAFNARDIDTVLEAMHPEVDWPNGWEGGRVLGHDGLREYWRRQWAVLDPHVQPVAFEKDAQGRTVVLVNSAVRDLDGKLVFEGMLTHIFSIEDGLVRRMDIGPG
jgi:hypothetical protein